MFEPRPQLRMTAVHARSRLWSLQAERLDAVEAGLDGNTVYMTDLREDIVAARATYVGLAMTEVATLRADSGAPRSDRPGSTTSMNAIIQDAYGSPHPRRSAATCRTRR